MNTAQIAKAIHKVLKDKVQVLSIEISQDFDYTDDSEQLSATIFYSLPDGNKGNFRAIVYDFRSNYGVETLIREAEAEGNAITGNSTKKIKLSVATTAAKAETMEGQE